MTFRDVAHEIGTAYGRPVAYRQLPVADYVAALLSTGLPTETATGLAYLFDEVLDGRNAHVEPGVHDVLGRVARDFAAFLGHTDVQLAQHG
jgi:hypothetical protein